MQRMRWGRRGGNVIRNREMGEGEEDMRGEKKCGRNE